MGKRRERRRGQARGTKQPVQQAVQPVHNLPLYDLLDEAGVQTIHEKSMQVLKEVGIAFYDDEACNILRANGVKVDDEQIAYFDEDTLMHFVNKAPSQFTQIARNPQNNITIGGQHMTFAPVYGPPFVWDADHGRRQATLTDFHNFVKLAYMTPYLHHSGGTIVEPTDEPSHTRHLDMVYAHIKYSDKPFMGSVTSPENAADSVRLCEILFGEDAIRQHPAMISLINISSPRRLDDRMLGALMVYARARQACILAPFILSGAMAPAAVPATLIQANAETLAAIAFAQMVSPGTPIIYGTFQTTVDMKSGAPVLGAPESQHALFLSAQMARHYNLPFRSGGAFASSKIPDAQAAYEAAMSMEATVLGRVNFALHSAGWLEGGLTAGYEKFIMDTEMLGMMHKFAAGIELTDESMAMESIRTVEPGGHHLGTPHTMRNMRTAFYLAHLYDYNSAEQWEAEGKQDIIQRANKKYKDLLIQYEAPVLDESTDEALTAYIEKRKREIKPSY